MGVTVQITEQALESLARQFFPHFTMQLGKAAVRDLLLLHYSK